METILLTLACMGFCALAVMPLWLLDVWIDWMEKRAHKRRPRRYCYDQRVVHRIRQ